MRMLPHPAALRRGPAPSPFGPPPPPPRIRARAGAPKRRRLGRPARVAREIQREEKSKALGEVAARLGVKLENAHRASDDAEAALLVMYHLARDERVPRAYAPFVQEQKRLAL